MSSNRKRAALFKANKEIEYLNSKVNLLSYHYECIKSLCTIAAKEAQAWRDNFPEHQYSDEDETIVAKKNLTETTT